MKKHPILLVTVVDRVLSLPSDNVLLSFILFMSTLLWPFMLMQTRLLDDKCHQPVVQIYRRAIGSGAAGRSASPSSLLVTKLSTISSLKIDWKIICISGRQTLQGWRRRKTFSVRKMVKVSDVAATISSLWLCLYCISLQWIHYDEMIMS